MPCGYISAVLRYFNIPFFILLITKAKNIYLLKVYVFTFNSHTI